VRGYFNGSVEAGGVDNVKIVENDEIEEMIPNTLEIRIDNVPRVVIYEPLACHNYNDVEVDDKTRPSIR
jgi:hypothetical protein